MNAIFNITLSTSNLITNSWGWKGGIRSCFMENKLVFSQFTGNKINISRFTKTKWHFVTQTYVTYDIWKLHPSRALLDVFIICQLIVLCIVHSHAILLITVKNNRRHDQNHGSQWIKYFFLISQRIILENHGSELLMKSQFMRKKQAISHFMKKKLGHSQITKIPFAALIAMKPWLRDVL